MWVFIVYAKGGDKKNESFPFPRHDPFPFDTIMNGLLQAARNAGRQKSREKLNQFIPNHLIFIYIFSTTQYPRKLFV